MHQVDPMVLLLAAMGDVSAGRGAGHAIEESERAGQGELCAKSKTAECELPREMDQESRAILEAAGVRFLGNVEKDALFQRAQLPAGWQVKQTDHSMWSDLCDDKGRKRAGIFYKAAFYDRSASLSISTRFKIDSFYNPDHDAVAVARVNDQGAFPFESERFTLANDGDRYGVYDRDTHTYSTPSKRDVARNQCSTWLTANFPDWKNPAAYWD